MGDVRATGSGWFERNLDLRARRALERQLEYQEHKSAGSGSDDDLGRTIFLRAQQIRQKISAVRPVSDTDKVLEVGSGAHGLVFVTENRISDAFLQRPLELISRSSTVGETKKAQRSAKNLRPQALLKKLFFKNALFELIAVKRGPR